MCLMVMMKDKKHKLVADTRGYLSLFLSQEQPLDTEQDRTSQRKLRGHQDGMQPG